MLKPHSRSRSQPIIRYFALMATIDGEVVIVNVYDDEAKANLCRGMLVASSSSVRVVLDRNKRGAARKVARDYKAIYSEELAYDLKSKQS